MGRRASTALVALVTTTALLAGAGPAAAGAATDESRFVGKHNAERRARGIRTLRVASDLVSVARRHSRAMASRGRIFHSSNLGSKVGGNWTEVGENVGAGPDVATLHRAFMQSASHRSNILHRAYNQIGVGVVYGADDTIYVTVVFAARGASTKVAKATTSTRSRPKKPAVTGTRRAAVAPKRTAPARRPVTPPQGRTVDVLVRLVQMDADLFEPTGGTNAP